MCNIFPYRLETDEESSLLGDFVPSPKKPVHPSSSFRALFTECEMSSEWELFESEVLRDITDSQFAFQVTLERIDVRSFLLFFSRLFCSSMMFPFEILLFKEKEFSVFMIWWIIFFSFHVG